MKRTVLNMTQSILSSLGSDEVNSISDTTESLQVAEIIKTSYLNMVSRLDLPEHNQLFQLTASDSINQPVLMLRPDGISRIEWITYFDDNATNSDSSSFIHDLNLDVTASLINQAPPPAYQNIVILTPKRFLDMVNQFNPNESNIAQFTFSTNNIDVGTPSSFNFNYRTDKTPQYCTIIQDYYLIFDSFDSSIDSTLQSSKSLCMGWVHPSFQLTDSYTPNLDEKQFALLLNEAKSLAFLELKQMPHPKADKEISRQMSSLQKFKALSERPTSFNQLPNYGRRGSGWPMQ